MVDADGVEVVQHRAEATDPPVELRAAVDGPVVVRVAPELPVAAERIGRAAGDDPGVAVLVEVEQVRVGPDVGGVEGDEDRDVADEADAFATRVVVEGGPLAVEEELDELVEADFRVELSSHVVQS